MKRGYGFRLWLFLAAFVCGQLAALAHGVEHVDAGEAPHVCLLCLAGHDLTGAAPPAAPSLLPALSPDSALPAAEPVTPPVVRPSQTLARGPPLA